MKKNMKVDEKYIKEAVDTHNKSIGNFDEEAQKYPMIKKNGATYYVVRMSREEFRKSIKSVNIDNIRWNI